MVAAHMSHVQPVIPTTFLKKWWVEWAKMKLLTLQICNVNCAKPRKICNELLISDHVVLRERRKILFDSVS